MNSGPIRLPADWRAWPLVAVALVLLNLSVTFVNVWPTPAVEPQAAFSVELAACVIVMAVVAVRARAALTNVLASVWPLLIAGRYMEVTAPALYGRPFNLYWDAPHLQNVAAMLTASVPATQLALGAAAIVAVVILTFFVIRLSLSCVAEAVSRRPMRLVLCALATVTLAGFATQTLRGEEISLRAESPLAAPVTPAYVRQLRSVLATMGGSAGPVLAASPAVLDATPNLGGADVQLVFVESYGAVTFDSPALAAKLESSRAALESAARESGRQLVSAFVESPTFGGSSWLAHLTLLTGIEVRDQYAYQSLMAQERPTLVSMFSRAGYRTVALMPGTRQAWPEGAFYAYDTIYAHADFEYQGPRFGWWAIPDQYTFAKLDALEGRGARRPLFVVFPTSTTHAPFGPVAPYQPSWSKALTADAYDAEEVARILGTPPDLTNMSSDYAHAMSYEFTTFAGYLRERAGDNLLMILVGDHQPAAAVAGRDAPWTVPVHVISSDEGVVRRLVSRGFRPGMVPERPSLGAMHELVPLLLDAFGAAP